MQAPRPANSTPQVPAADSAGALTFAQRGAVINDLAAWIEATPDAREIAHRNEAIDRIIRCAHTRDIELDLEGLALSSLPEAVSGMSWLISLKLRDNRLTDTPPLDNLLALRSLDLRSNHFTTLTDNLRRLPPHCVVMLAGNNISLAERQAWFSSRTADAGPQVFIDRPGLFTFAQTAHPGHVPQTSALSSARREAPVQHNGENERLRREISLHRRLAQLGLVQPNLQIEILGQPVTITPLALADALHLWRDEAGGYGTLLGEFPEATLSDLAASENASGFALWLARLTETAEYSEPLARTLLHGRVFRLIEACIADRDLRAVCFAIAAQAHDTCGDRVALGLNQMEMARINALAERGEIDAAALFKLGRSQFLLEEIRRIAKAHATRTRREHETVEVELAFQVGLRERLDLPLGVRAMLYRASAAVEDKDLDEAGSKIEALLAQAASPILARLGALDDPDHAPGALLDPPEHHALARFLAADFRPWGQRAAREFPDKIEALTERMHEALDALFGRLQNNLINEGTYHRASLEAMFHANHGIAYRLALAHLAATQA